MAAVLIDDDRIELPEGFCVVTRGVLRKGDLCYDPEAGEWCSLSDESDYYCIIGESVKDCWAVIRRDPALIPTEQPAEA